MEKKILRVTIILAIIAIYYVLHLLGKQMPVGIPLGMVLVAVGSNLKELDADELELLFEDELEQQDRKLPVKKGASKSVWVADKKRSKANHMRLADDGLVAPKGRLQ